MPLKINQRQVEARYYEEPLALDGSIPLRMMLIPAGSFLMGSSEDEDERRQSESPQHEVKLSQFFMAKYPVTQAQWRVVAAMPQVNQALEVDPSHFKGDDRPVERVSWHDTVEFCDRLTLHTDRQYRLPTEAEWEYACRAGTTTPFHFGPTLSTDYANYNGADKENGVYGPGTHGEYRKETTPVDQFPGANAYGLHDMHGNVWEWCQDHWHNSYEDAPTDGSAWEDKDKDARRILRGGSWIYNPRYCRSAYRAYDTPVNRNSSGSVFELCVPRPGLLSSPLPSFPFALYKEKTFHSLAAAVSGDVSTFTGNVIELTQQLGIPIEPVPLPPPSTP